MAHVSDTMHPAPAVEPARMLDGGRLLARGAQRVGGVALVLAACALWLQPGAVLEVEILLMKMGISLAMALSGMALLHAARARRGMRVDIDLIRREVRLVRAGNGGRLVSRTPFARLGRAEQVGHMVRFWDADGSLIAEVALTDPATHRRLVAALQDARKL